MLQSTPELFWAWTVEAKSSLFPVNDESFDYQLIFTARMRRMGEGTVFSLFVSPHPDVGGGGQYSISGLDGEVPIQLMGGVPHLGDWGVPHLRSRWRVPHPADGGGVLHPGGGDTPSPVQDWMGYSPSQA